MTNIDVFERADNRQLFVLFPSELDELAALSQRPDYTDHQRVFITYHYLFERRNGFSHHESMVRTRYEIKRLKSGQYGNEHPRN